MKALVYDGPRDVLYQDRPVPTLEEGHALIRINYAGICGTDLVIYAGKHKRAAPPLIMGHEFAGEIVDLQAQGTHLAIGDRVVAEPLLPCGECYACTSGSYWVCKSLKLLGVDEDGAFAEFAKAPINRIYKIPEALSLQAAALVEPAAVAVHAVRRSRAQLGSRAVVLGGGPIGLLVAQVARAATAMPVELVEVNDWRIGLARQLGFDPIDAKKGGVEKEVLSRTGGNGADVLFDAAGAATTVLQQPELTRIHGQVVMVAIPEDPRPVNLASIALKEIELVGVRVYNSSDYETAISLVAERRINLEPLVSHVFPLEDGQEAIELFEKGTDCMKVLLRP